MKKNPNLYQREHSKCSVCICVFVYKVTICNECLLDIVQNKYKKPEIFVYVIWNTLMALECVKSTPEDSRSHISQCLL